MLTSDGSVLIGALMGAISLLYATAGQAGGTAFLAVMAVASFPPAQMKSFVMNNKTMRRRQHRVARHDEPDRQEKDDLALLDQHVERIGEEPQEPDPTFTHMPTTWPWSCSAFTSWYFCSGTTRANTPKARHDRR